MVTEQRYWRKILCGCVRFVWLWQLLAIMKRCTERCTLQLYRTSLTNMILNTAENREHPGMMLIDFQKAFDTLLRSSSFTGKMKCLGFSS